MLLRSTLATLAIAGMTLAPLAATAQDKARSYTRAELKAIIKDTLMEDPQIIIDAVEQLQIRKEAEKEQQAKQTIAAYRTSLFEDKDSPAVGAQKADVTMVEFFDYNCGYCKRTLPNVLKLLKEDPKVKVVFKEYPVLAPSSEDAARAGVAMYYLNPERYLDYHAALFQLGGKFDEKNLTSVAEGMGVEPEAFKKMMQSDRVSKHLDDNRQLAAKMGASGVPMFVIGNEMIPGAISYEAMTHQISVARQQKK